MSNGYGDMGFLFRWAATIKARLDTRTYKNDYLGMVCMPESHVVIPHGHLFVYRYLKSIIASMMLRTLS